MKNERLMVNCKPPKMPKGTTPILSPPKAQSPDQYELYVKQQKLTQRLHKNRGSGLKFKNKDIENYAKHMEWFENYMNRGRVAQ